MTPEAKAEVTQRASDAAASWVANPDLMRPTCPYWMGSDSAVIWTAAFERELLRHSAVGDADERGA